MNHTFLSATMDYNVPIDGLADRAAFGGMMVLLGMLTIFSVLIIIMLALVIFKVVFHDIPEKRSSQPKEEAKPAVKEPVYVPVTNDDEVVAAIAAAIAMAESESSGMKFRVVSFRRV